MTVEKEDLDGTEAGESAPARAEAGPRDPVAVAYLRAASALERIAEAVERMAEERAARPASARVARRRTDDSDGDGAADEGAPNEDDSADGMSEEARLEQEIDNILSGGS